jgi:RHS repeat-associated protein
VVLVTEQRNGESCAQVTRTQYDSAGRVTALQYPTGRLVEYVYNGTEPTVPSSIWTQVDGEPMELVSQVTAAGGRVTGWHSWNGIENRAGAYVTGQPRSSWATLEGSSVSHRYVVDEDAQGNPLHINDLTPATTENLTYDPAFLTLMTAQSEDPNGPAPYRDIQYTVARGLEGNRLKVRQLMPSVSASDMCVAQTVESLRTSTYQYPADSSRLQEIHVEQTDSETGQQWEMSNLFFYTASGALSSWTVYDDKATYFNPMTGELETTSVAVRSVEIKYDQEDEMVEWTDDTTTHRYEYDSRRLRSRKLLADGGKTQFWYLGGGQLLSEVHVPTNGIEPTTSRDYVWLGGTVAAFVDSQVMSGGVEDDSEAAAYFVHSGLLSEAKVVTDASGLAVWQGERDPFGTMNSRTAGSLAGGYAIGFPGQYTDVETGLAYNWFRYYNPAIGRYLESDPLLAAGMPMPPYSYANGNPLVYTDPDGRDVIVLPLPAAGAGAGAVGGAVTAGAAVTAAGMAGWMAGRGIDSLPVPGFSSMSEGIQYALDQMFAKPPKDASDPDGSKAPGKPGAAEGFKDPKGGPDWVPNPNGKGHGWRDAKGNVWVPTGKGQCAHGGPHWDVQSPGGGYTNVYPGGGVRK